MAKADFCFTYYDGDAARDMAHMNRLERGAYSDIVISQRKFGHLTRDQIKKILGKDFDDCFGAVELVLKRDEKGLFFIEWLEQSEKKAKIHSKRQSDKRIGKTKQQPNNNQTEPNGLKKLPLEDGNEDVNEIESILLNGLDEIYLEQQRMKWKHIDFDLEVNSFKEKVRGSPNDYRGRDASGIRLAFQYQLRNAKNKSNGTIKSTKLEQDRNRLSESMRLITGKSEI